MECPMCLNQAQEDETGKAVCTECGVILREGDPKKKLDHVTPEPAIV